MCLSVCRTCFVTSVGNSGFVQALGSIFSIWSVFQSHFCFSLRLVEIINHWSMRLEMDFLQKWSRLGCIDQDWSIAALLLLLAAAVELLLNRSIRSGEIDDLTSAAN